LLLATRGDSVKLPTCGVLCHAPKLIVAGFADPLQVDLADKVAEVFLGGGLRALEQAGGVLVGQVEHAAAVDPL
jgi:hypothetical protein